MIIREIDDKKRWEDFVSECTEKTFCQSWNWGIFNQSMGDKVWRFGIFENEQLVAIAQVLKIKARRGSFLFVPHGPLIALGDKKEIIKSILEKLKDLAKTENVNFIRFSPILEVSDSNIFKELGFRNAPIHMHPELTWELDISLSEEDILKGMRKTTRYLIKQAEKNEDIEITRGTSDEMLNDFEKLYLETAERQSFTPFSNDYLKKEVDAFKNDNQILIFSGKYKGEVVSSAIIVYYSGIGFYHQGASSLKYPKVPVSYLLQWEAIKEAKTRGCRLYNFWGVIPEATKNHPWAGLSLFKKGFGGFEKEYVKTQDYVLSNKYWLTYIIEQIRRRKRHL
ncbi:MAG: lipid II:glycine glycyltransferase FemX [Minisyncoccales bacterium]|jgi:peptidoglycan pentaglycine glycine transferase (the first glycine)|nr:peptidoglycan bridge formation glycyltransferase FemA/FemB family protein [Candidatus Pacearchaeota archaeon]